MKKQGFTLAEVLITLVIVGVVAILVIPTLIFNIKQQQYAAAFAKALNTLENNNRILLSRENATLLSEICGDKYIPHCLGNQTILLWNSESGMYMTKDGIGFKQLGIGEDEEPENLMTGKYYEVLLDVNGVKDPNTLCEDQYNVSVDYNGSVKDITVCNKEY